MSNLKNVRAELEKMKKEMAAKEAELKREEARPVIEIVNDALLNSETVQEKMSAYSKDEARVIAKHFVENIDTIISESEDEINVLRAKKKERAEKRKAAKLDTATPTGKLMLTMIAAINEFERANILERQREGIELARQRGVYRGRKPIEVEDFGKYYEKYMRRVYTKTELAEELGISRPTLDRLIYDYLDKCGDTK